MTTKLKIDERIQAFLPVQTAERDARLEQSCLEEGILDPIRVWKGKDVIVDGHRRYLIAQRHDLQFNYVELEFKDLPDVFDWMITNQDNRRNWTEHQKAYCIGAAMNARKQSHGGTRKKKTTTTTTTQEVEPGANGETSKDKTAREISTEEGVSVATVKRNAAIATAVDKIENHHPGFRSLYLSGDLRITATDLGNFAAMTKRDRAKVIKVMMREEDPTLSYKAALDEAFPISDGSEDGEEDDGSHVEIRDGLGKVVTEKSLFGVFEELDHIEIVLSQLRAAKSKASKAMGLSAASEVNRKEVNAGLKSAIDELELNKPHVTCTDCNGSGKTVKDDGSKPTKCSTCDGRKWLTKFQYEHVLDAKEQKVAAGRAE